jgi:hypothetical protein
LIIRGVAKAKTVFVSFVFDADPKTRSFTLTLKNETSRKAFCYRKPVTLSQPSLFEMIPQAEAMNKIKMRICGII